MGGLRGTSGAPSSEDTLVRTCVFLAYMLRCFIYLFIIYSLYLTSYAVATFSAGRGGGGGRKKFNPVLYFYHVNNNKIIITKTVTIKRKNKEHFNLVCLLV